MSKKLYVGNCPFSFNDSTLQDLFSQFGTVESAKIITDRNSGRSKGFGFVEMSTEEEAREAIAQLNGTEQDGRALTVSEAKPMTPRDNNRDRGDRGGRRGGGGGGGYGRY